MARSNKLRVMISSRCDDNFPIGSEGRQLSEIRKEIKKEIEEFEVFGKKLFEVWINEDEAPQGGTWDSWEVCEEAVKDCDILIALSNGNSGWAISEGDIGICHAELMTGLTRAPAKVRIIALDDIKRVKSPQGKRNSRFQQYVQDQSLFRGGKISSIGDLKKRVKETVWDALLKLAQSGVREASRGRYHSGQALDWARLDFVTRQQQICEILKDTMMQHPGSDINDDCLIVKFGSVEVVVVTNAIPAASTVGPAKEMVGQPFLHDYKLLEYLKRGRGGPVHIIGCYKNATETQATKLLGFPDATTVTAPFGVFLADNIHKVQFAFIANCRDESTTRHGLQRFFEWLSQTGEDKNVADRAKARARIVTAIAKEAVK